MKIEIVTTKNEGLNETGFGALKAPDFRKALQKKLKKTSAKPLK